jgi:hypothetical protein
VNPASPSPTQRGVCPRAALRADPWGLGPPSPAMRERVPNGARRVRVFAGVAIILVLAIAGCGKRNAPQPPPDAPNTYPRPYPNE